MSQMSCPEGFRKVPEGSGKVFAYWGECWDYLIGNYRNYRQTTRNYRKTLGSYRKTVLCIEGTIGSYKKTTEMYRKTVGTLYEN